MPEAELEACDSNLREPIEELASALLSRLEMEGIGVCVARNYEGYPHHITGDIDLVVAAIDLARAARAVRNAAEASGWCCFVEYIGSRSTHSGYYRDCFPKRFVLTVECFAGGGWRGLEFLSAQRIITARRWNGVCWVPSPAHEAILTLVHHLLYNGKVFEKYRERIHASASRDETIFQDELRAYFGEWFGRVLATSVFKLRWERLESLGRWMRVMLLLRSLALRPFVTCRSFYEILRDMRRKPVGAAIVLRKLPDAIADRIGDQLLVLATRWHIFLPIRCRVEASLRKATARRITSVLRRGGVVVVIDHAGTSPVDAETIPSMEVTWGTSGVEARVDGAIVALPLASDGMAASLWNALLKGRCERLR